MTARRELQADETGRAFPQLLEADDEADEDRNRDRDDGEDGDVGSMRNRRPARKTPVV
jgi:hypothetical protein